MTKVYNYDARVTNWFLSGAKSFCLHDAHSRYSYEQYSFTQNLNYNHINTKSRGMTHFVIYTVFFLYLRLKSMDVEEEKNINIQEEL